MIENFLLNINIQPHVYIKNIMQSHNINSCQAANNIFREQVFAYLVTKNIYKELLQYCIQNALWVVEENNNLVNMLKYSDVSEDNFWKLLERKKKNKIKLKIKYPDGVENFILAKFNLKGASYDRIRWFEKTVNWIWRVKLSHTLSFQLLETKKALAQEFFLRKQELYYRRILTGLVVGQVPVLALAYYDNQSYMVIISADGELIYKNIIKDTDSLSSSILCALIEHKIKYISWSKRYSHPRFIKLIPKLCMQNKINQGLVLDNNLELIKDGNIVALSLARRLQNPFMEFISQEPLMLLGVAENNTALQLRLSKAKSIAKNENKFNLNKVTADILCNLYGVSKTVALQLIQHRPFADFNEIRKIIILTEHALELLRREFTLDELQVRNIKLPKANINTLNVKDLLPGTVSKVVSFGIFIDLGRGVSGLVHKTNTDVNSYSKGDKLWLIVESINKTRQRINLNILDSSAESFNKKPKDTNTYFASKLALAFS